jgi:hypothetical protein
MMFYLNNYRIYLSLKYQNSKYCLFVELRRFIRNYLTIDFNYTTAHIAMNDRRRFDTDRDSVRAG